MVWLSPQATWTILWINNTTPNKKTGKSWDSNINEHTIIKNSSSSSNSSCQGIKQRHKLLYLSYIFDTSNESWNILISLWARFWILWINRPCGSTQCAIIIATPGPNATVVSNCNSVNSSTGDHSNLLVTKRFHDARSADGQVSIRLNAMGKLSTFATSESEDFTVSSQETVLQRSNIPMRLGVNNNKAPVNNQQVNIQFENIAQCAYWI